MSFESSSYASQTSIDSINSLDASEDRHHLLSPVHSPPPHRPLPSTSTPISFPTIIKTISDWFGSPTPHIVFDSDINGWAHSSFSAIVASVPHLVVIHFTTANDVFGCTFPTPLAPHDLCWLDNTHAIFSLQSNGRIPSPRRWFRRDFDPAESCPEGLATFYDAGPLLYDVSEALFVSPPPTPSTVTFVLDNLYGTPSLRSLLFSDAGQRVVVSRIVCFGAFN